jgi:thiosulfate/3-mercaptopyruvate sulfurtransferase
MNLIITSKELAKLSKRNLIIVDCRDFIKYRKGHVPGAINLDMMQFHWIDTSKEGIKQFNRQSRILLSNIGVDSTKYVIFYDDTSGPSAARGIWLLHYFSHKKTSILDGGFEKWRRMGQKIETKTNAYSHSRFRGRINSKIISSFDDVRSAISNKRVIIIDSRSTDEYKGSIIRAARGGHIPGALNIDWVVNIDGKNGFKNRKVLGKIYSDIPRSRTVVTYCQGGYRAANTYVVLKMLGYKRVKMYLGSWGEWANKTQLPVENASC